MNTPVNHDRRSIARYLCSALEIYLTLLGWVLVLALAWMRNPIVGKPYELNTVGYIATCLFAGLLPLAIVTRRRTSAEMQSMVVSPSPALKIFWLACVASLGLSAIVSIYSMQVVLGADLSVEDYRAIKGQITDSPGLIGQLNYLLMALGLFGCYLTNRLEVSNKARMLFAAYLLGLSALVYLKVGVRTHFLAPVAVFAVSYLQFQTKHDHTKRFRIGAIVASGIAVLVLLNATLSAVGARGGFFGSASQAMGDRGAVMLQGLGVKNPGIEASVIFAFLDEYLLAPVSHLDFYVNHVDHEPAYGALQFDFLARRFGFEEGYIVKLDVDAAYGALGLKWNVWATAIREIAIDFGKDVGVVLAFAVIGLLAAVAKISAPRSLAAGLIFTMLASFLVVSPTTSLFRSAFFQYGFYFGMAAWIFEIVSTRRHFTTRGTTSSQSRHSAAEALFNKRS